MRRVDSLEKTLMLGGIGGRRRRGRMDMSLSELRELVMDREVWHTVIRGVAKSRTRLSDCNWISKWGGKDYFCTINFCLRAAF